MSWEIYEKKKIIMNVRKENNRSFIQLHKFKCESVKRASSNISDYPYKPFEYAYQPHRIECHQTSVTL